jgi:hypothetical protein
MQLWVRYGRLCTVTDRMDMEGEALGLTLMKDRLLEVEVGTRRHRIETTRSCRNHLRDYYGVY